MALHFNVYDPPLFIRPLFGCSVIFKMPCNRTITMAALHTVLLFTMHLYCPKVDVVKVVELYISTTVHVRSCFLSHVYSSVPRIFVLHVMVTFFPTGLVMSLGWTVTGNNVSMVENRHIFILYFLHTYRYYRSHFILVDYKISSKHCI